MDTDNSTQKSTWVCMYCGKVRYTTRPKYHCKCGGYNWHQMLESGKAKAAAFWKETEYWEIRRRNGVAA